MKTQLEQIIEAGFENSGEKYGDYLIYRCGGHNIIYNPIEDKAILRLYIEKAEVKK